MATDPMADLLANVTTFLTTLLTWCGQIISTITGNEYLMIGFCFVIVSFAIGVVVRLVGKLGHSAR